MRSGRPLWKVWARINVYKNTTKMTSELLKRVVIKLSFPGARVTAESVPGV